MEVPGRRIPDGSDVARQLDRRRRRVKRALLVGGATLLVAVIGSYVAGGSKPSGNFSWQQLIWLLCVFATPAASAVAGANLTSSDSVLKRTVLAVLTGAAGFLIMIYLIMRAYFDGGGSVHM